MTAITGLFATWRADEHTATGTGMAAKAELHVARFLRANGLLPPGAAGAAVVQTEQSGRGTSARLLGDSCVGLYEFEHLCAPADSPAWATWSDAMSGPTSPVQLV